MSSDTSSVTLMLALHRDQPTDRAILVSETGESPTMWLPRSKIAMKPTGRTERCGLISLPIVEVELPEWLATEKGLV